MCNNSKALGKLDKTGLKHVSCATCMKNKITSHVFQARLRNIVLQIMHARVKNTVDGKYSTSSE